MVRLCPDTFGEFSIHCLFPGGEISNSRSIMELVVIVHKDGRAEVVSSISPVQVSPGQVNVRYVYEK